MMMRRKYLYFFAYGVCLILLPLLPGFAEDIDPEMIRPQSSRAYVDEIKHQRLICAGAMENLLKALQSKEKDKDIQGHLDEYAGIFKNKHSKDFTKRLQGWLVKADGYVNQSEAGFLKRFRELEWVWGESNLEAWRKLSALLKRPQLAKDLGFDEQVAALFLKPFAALSKEEREKIGEFYKRFSRFPKARDFYGAQKKRIKILEAYQAFLEEHLDLDIYIAALQRFQDYAWQSFAELAPKGFELTALELGLQSLLDGTSVLPAARLKKGRVKGRWGVEVVHPEFKYKPYYKRAFRSFDGTLVIKYVYDPATKREIASIRRYEGEAKSSWWGRLKSTVKRWIRLGD